MHRNVCRVVNALYQHIFRYLKAYLNEEFLSAAVWKAAKQATLPSSSITNSSFLPRHACWYSGQAAYATVTPCPLLPGASRYLHALPWSRMPVLCLWKPSTLWCASSRWARCAQPSPFAGRSSLGHIGTVAGLHMPQHPHPSRGGLARPCKYTRKAVSLQ